MFGKVFVFAPDAGTAAELCSAARGMGEKVVLATSCADSFGADAVYSLPADRPVPLYLGALSELIKEVSPELVLCGANTDGRLVAGIAAAALGASPLCDISSLVCEGDTLTAVRMVYGGTAFMTETCKAPAVAVVQAGAFEPAEAAGTAEALPLPEAGAAGLELVSVAEAEASSVNLAAAKRVVGVGRGLGSADNIPALEKLAAALGAEIGCTRPVAEEEHWYSKERYIGVSGCMLKPAFYLAVGISGQVQHMVGVNQAGVIFAIDKNENAPIVAQADYTLVGDAATALPQILDKLGA